jgi:hypothetical protein
MKFINDWISHNPKVFRIMRIFTIEWNNMWGLTIIILGIGIEIPLFIHKWEEK